MSIRAIAPFVPQLFLDRAFFASILVVIRFARRVPLHRLPPVAHEGELAVDALDNLVLVGQAGTVIHHHLGRDGLVERMPLLDALHAIAFGQAVLEEKAQQRVVGLVRFWSYRSAA